MPCVYCTPADVAMFCSMVTYDGDRVVFGTKPLVPNQAEIEEMIAVAEEELEKECNTAWGTKAITVTDEYHDLWAYVRELSFGLNNVDILPFSSGSGDKLEIWDGLSWVDWLTTYTEGRDDDFWVDYKLGRVYFVNRRPGTGKQLIRATYRHNSGSSVPLAIKKATALLVGIELANSEHASILFPEGEAENIPAATRISRWESKIESIIKKYRISQIPVNLPFVPVGF